MKVMLLIGVFISFYSHALVGYTPTTIIWNDGHNVGPDPQELAQLFFDQYYPNNTPVLLGIVDVIHPTNAFFNRQNARYYREGDTTQLVVHTVGRPLLLQCPAATDDNANYDEAECRCTVGKSLFTEAIEDDEEGCRIEVDKNPTCLNSTKNPCDIRTGVKYRNDVDFSYSKFTFTRNYHSQNLEDIGFGVGWHNQFFKSISVQPHRLSINGADGRGEIWQRHQGSQFLWIDDADSNYILQQSSSTRHFSITNNRGDIERYDSQGRLLSETDPQGKITTYIYDIEGRLSQVSNHYQQSLSFEYSVDGKNHIIKVIDDQGVEYGYEYDANDNLTAVVYPDTDSDPANNPKRIYHYENPDFPNHITGITNANGDRYATFAYDADGKAIESALAPTTNPIGQQRVQLNYATPGVN